MCDNIICHTVGTPAANVTFSLSINSKIDLPSIAGPGNTILQPVIAAEYGRPHAFTWNIGTTGSTAVARAHVQRVRQGACKRMQHGRAMAVKHRLGIAGRAAGVTHAGGGVFVELGPVIGCRLRADPALVTAQAGYTAIGRQLVGVAQGDEMPDRRQLAVNRLDDGQEAHVETQDLILGVVGNPGDLLRMQAWVERMQHPPRTADTKVQLEVAVAVPGQRGNPVAERRASVGPGHWQPGARDRPVARSCSGECLPRLDAKRSRLRHGGARRNRSRWKSSIDGSASGRAWAYLLSWGSDVPGGDWPPVSVVLRNWHRGRDVYSLLASGGMSSTGQLAAWTCAFPRAKRRPRRPGFAGTTDLPHSIRPSTRGWSRLHCRRPTGSGKVKGWPRRWD